MDALIVDQVDDRAAPADDQERVVVADVVVELRSSLRVVVRLELAQVVRRAGVRALGDPAGEAQRVVQPVRLVEDPRQRRPPRGWSRSARAAGRRRRGRCWAAARARDCRSAWRTRRRTRPCRNGRADRPVPLPNTRIRTAAPGSCAAWRLLATGSLRGRRPSPPCVLGCPDSAITPIPCQRGQSERKYAPANPRVPAAQLTAASPVSFPPVHRHIASTPRSNCVQSRECGRSPPPVRSSAEPPTCPVRRRGPPVPR